MDWAHAIAIAATLFSVAVYFFYVSQFLLAMRRPTAAARGVAPLPLKVSVLKPLAGIDDELEENLETFARQEGCEYELLLGVASRRDPAWRAAERFVSRHPELDVRLVKTNPAAAINPKVAQLIGLERVARGEVIVISDANARVQPDYLRTLLCELAEPGVGLVSSAISGDGEKTLGSAIDNLILLTHASPGAMSAAYTTGRAITIGKSMAMRRADLLLSGGFRGVSDVLAEDHALGRKFGAMGLEVRICTQPVENRNVAGTLRRAFNRHARWSKMRRAMAPTGLAAEPFLMPSVIATLAMIAKPSPDTALLFVMAGLIQALGMQLFVRALRGSFWPWHLVPLEFARSWVLFGGWAVAWVSRRVDWRGHEFEIGDESTLIPARPPLWTRVFETVREWV